MGRAEMVELAGIGVFLFGVCVVLIGFVGLNAFTVGFLGGMTAVYGLAMIGSANRHGKP